MQQTLLEPLRNTFKQSLLKKKVISVRFACVPVSLPLTCIPVFNSWGVKILRHDPSLVGLNLELRPPRRFRGRSDGFFRLQTKKSWQKKMKNGRSFFPWFPTSSTIVNKNQFIRCDLKITPWKFTFKNLSDRWFGDLLRGGGQGEGDSWLGRDGGLVPFRTADCLCRF